MKRFNIKEALYFGTTMTLFKIVEKIWAGDLFSANFVGHVVIYGLINGILFGFLFGTFVRYFQFSKFVATTTKIAPNQMRIFCFKREPIILKFSKQLEENFS